ncbi:bromodomain-containing protein DDB_G0270170 isoform X1 [Ricinus communis]|uniref:bromodomain-containing protein DDB_G0270170 isoform X1 n=1 Tax=Ricinus communis TaxID=3988 RepID=UPI00201A8B75|nr:bromodomain-containing protein DDB_G0270170 isoform X1 [Ricinus communis]
MRNIWREGHRRSPRISALDANIKKAQPSRFITVAQSRCSNNTNTTLHGKDHLKKRPCLSTGAGPASRTRGKKKRKLRPLQDVAAFVNAQEDPKSSDEQDGRQVSPEDLQITTDQPIVQSKEHQKYKDQVINPDQPPAGQRVSWIPKKRILELILDVLQRRDTHEIFAEPVNQEVEDYYEIIKEPMDFGTMRAKLHEGMYNSLEQFEHDVFLISRNAMHFNSSSTIYFRQARAIDELAKKVFHVLKTDPENFEFEFSGTRRRTSRRPKCEAKSSACSSSSKLITNSNTGMLNVSRTTVLSSASSITNLRTAMRLIPRCSGSGLTTQSELRDEEVPFGGGDGRGSSSSEADRRSTYRSSSLSVLNGSSIVSTIYSNSKLLMHMDQQDNSYRQSLMLFVKDLGPTAQMIAKRKLNGWSPEAANYLNSGSNWPTVPNRKNHGTFSFSQWMPTTLETKSQNLINGYKIDMLDADKGEKAFSGDRMGIRGSSMEVVSHGYDRSVFGAIRQEAWSSSDTKAGDVSRSDNFQQNQNSMIQIGSPSSITNGRNLKFSAAGLNNEKKSAQLKVDKSKRDDKLQLLDSASKESQPNVLEHKLSNNYSFSSPSWTLETTANGKSGCDQTIGSINNLTSPYVRGHDQAVATRGQGASQETGWTLKSSQTLTLVPQFMFDLPFLKTRLDEMNYFGQDRFLQQTSGGQGPFLSETYHENHPYSCLDTQLNNYALQL